MRRLQSIGIAAFVCFATSSALAQIHNFVFPIDGLQPVPSTGSPGTGIGNVTYDQGTGNLSWNITFGGLLAPQTAAHFHGPAPFGVNAGVQVPIGIGSPAIGNAPITAAQGADLLNGLWYVNIHTTQFPGGEIRGQVVPAPGAVGILAGFGLLAMGRRRR